MFNTQLGYTVRTCHLVRSEAVVEHVLCRAVGHLHARADVGEAVELGADLADLGAEELVVVHQLVLFAKGAAGWRRRNKHGVGALPEEGHAALVDLADVVDLAGFHETGRPLNHIGCDPVRGACLVVGTPCRRPPGTLFAGL